MRRAGGIVEQATRHITPQVGPESNAWWESRLLPYRQLVLFLWSALTFSPSVLPGAAIWALLHVLVMSLFQFSGSVLEVLGNLLVMFSILYALLHLGLKYGNLTLFPISSGENEPRFQEICGLMATQTVVFNTGVRSMADSRHSNPKMFYGSGLLLSFLLFHIGYWLSTAHCVHLLVCGLLLLPLVLERYKPEPEQLRIKVQRMWTELTFLAKQFVLKVQQSFRNNRTRVPANRRL